MAANVLISSSAVVTFVDPAVPPVESLPENRYAGYVVEMPRPPTAWSNATRATFPTLGPVFNAFESEIVASPDADAASIVAKYAAFYASNNLASGTESEITTRLNKFATDYVTWRA